RDPRCRACRDWDTDAAPRAGRIGPRCQARRTARRGTTLAATGRTSSCRRSDHRRRHARGSGDIGIRLDARFRARLRRNGDVHFLGFVLASYRLRIRAVGSGIEGFIRIGSSAIETAVIAEAFVLHAEYQRRIVDRSSPAKVAAGLFLAVVQLPVDELQLILEAGALQRLMHDLLKQLHTRSEPLPDAHRSALGIDGVGIEAAFLFQISDDSGGLRTGPSLRHEVLHRLRNLGFAVAGTLWVKIARVIFWRAAMHVVE